MNYIRSSVQICNRIDSNSLICRDGEIRTPDPLFPKQVRYQAAPRPVIASIHTSVVLACLRRIFTRTLLKVKSSVESLEGNKVKVIVEVTEEEFDRDLDIAFKRLAREVKLPGFRPGKAPRKVIEARIGSEYARSEAFREGLPSYYAEAVKELDVDVIAPPSIDITEGEETGPITFEAEVEVRPELEITGYESLEVEIPSPVLSESDLDEAVDRLRAGYGELVAVDRAAANGDRVKVDIAAVHEGEPVAGLTADDYTYEIGMEAVVPELDAQLTGSKAGDTLEFEAEHPAEEEEEKLQFTVTVKEVLEMELPEATDEWAVQNTEFETMEELREDYRTRLGTSRINQANAARGSRVAEAIAALVDGDDLPDAMVEHEMERRAQDLSLRLQAQGIDFEQYLQFSGQPREAVIGELQATADTAARLDLALRSIAVAENIEASDEELEVELERVSTEIGRTVEDVRAQFESVGQLSEVRWDLRKAKALDWVSERTKVVDPDGNEVSEESLELPEEPAEDDEKSEDGTQESD